MPIRQDTLRRRWFAANNYAASTEKTYTETLTDFERRYPICAERVRHEHLVDYLTTTADGSPTNRAPSTLDRQRTVLRVFWKWTKREGYVKQDPSEGLGHIHLGRGQRRLGRWLTRDEANQLLDACEAGDQGQRNRTMMLVALLTGLRRAELVVLTWRHVDVSQRRLTVQGKGAKLATIGLPDQARSALLDWRQVVADRQGRRAPGPNQPVFPTGHKHGGLNNSIEDYSFDWNSPLALWTVRAIIARRAEAAGLATVATHDLRRSFAGFLDEDGVDLKGIQVALRHSSPDVTARCYLDRSPRRAVENRGRLASMRLPPPIDHRRLHHGRYWRSGAVHHHRHLSRPRSASCGRGSARQDRKAEQGPPTGVKGPASPSTPVIKPRREVNVGSSPPRSWAASRRSVACSPIARTTSVWRSEGPVTIS